MHASDLPLYFGRVSAQQAGHQAGKTAEARSRKRFPRQTRIKEQSLEKRLADLTELKMITATYEVKTSTLRGNHVTRQDKYPMTKQDYEKILLLLNKIDPHLLTAICKNKYEILKKEIKNKLERFLNESTL